MCSFQKSASNFRSEISSRIEWRKNEMFHKFSIDYRLNNDWNGSPRPERHWFISKLRSFENKASRVGEKKDIKSSRTLFFHVKEDENFRISPNWRAIMRRDPESLIEKRARHSGKNRVLEISIKGEGKSDNVARFRYNGASTNLPQNNTSLRDRVQAWLHLTQEWRIERVDQIFQIESLAIVPVSVEFGLLKRLINWTLLEHFL